MGKEKLIIVESPTKAKTIKKFLPKYTIIASMGHIRDLPKGASEIPEAIKKEPWSYLGIDVNNGFKPYYVINKDKQKIIKEINNLVNGANEIYLATDEDREGESISWHISEVIKAKKKPIKRLVFHEITKKALINSFNNLRDINLNLVRAQEARRLLDRLVGFTVSPILWKKIAPNLSAGRVQSLILKYLVERELNRINFKSSSYWDLTAYFEKNNIKFSGQLYLVDGVKIARGINFNPETGKLFDDNKVKIIDEKLAKKLVSELKDLKFIVNSIDKKITKRNPPNPFITSTLQQEAIKKFKISSKQVMSIAQSLYEKGFITYMRTDSTNIADEAEKAINSYIKANYGDEYIGSVKNKKKIKNAQEAHEAIRPVGANFMHPEKTNLENLEKKLYELIWARTIASRMNSVELYQITCSIKCLNTEFRSYGQEIKFLGFWKVYSETSDELIENREILLPKLSEKEILIPKKIVENEHNTEPKARFTEASLVKLMEKEGIGRPSTYSTVIDTVITRGYVKKKREALYPTIFAFAVNNLLSVNIPQLVDAKFTADMEFDLDNIANGKLSYDKYLNDFYFGKNGLEKKAKYMVDKINPQDYRSLKLPNFDLNINIGKYGPYSKYSNEKENYTLKIPLDVPPAELNKNDLIKELRNTSSSFGSLGIDPKTEKPIYYLIGPYGPYLQIGDSDKTSNIKPKRVSLPVNTKPDELSFGTIIKLFELPITLGKHPKSNDDIKINLGKYGPYVVHFTNKKDYRSLESIEVMLNLSLDDAIKILNKDKSESAKKPIRTIGNHPEDKKVVAIYNGPYGKFIKWNNINVSLPKGANINNIDLTIAIELIEKKRKNNKK